mmetsp:Transcript_16899/g.33011  ORF Transcript_16899/g.33011 Transcript_16899/m.33011 type:complete len:265 (-) Transcript_16899:497-1291(-)
MTMRCATVLCFTLTFSIPNTRTLKAPKPCSFIIPSLGPTKPSAIWNFLCKCISKTRPPSRSPFNHTCSNARSPKMKRQQQLPIKRLSKLQKPISVAGRKKAKPLLVILIYLSSILFQNSPILAICLNLANPSKLQKASASTWCLASNTSTPRTSSFSSTSRTTWRTSSLKTFPSKWSRTTRAGKKSFWSLRQQSSTRSKAQFSWPWPGQTMPLPLEVLATPLNLNTKMLTTVNPSVMPRPTSINWKSWKFLKVTSSLEATIWVW